MTSKPAVPFALATAALALALPASAGATPNRTTQLPGVGSMYKWSGGPVTGASTGAPTCATANSCDDTLVYIGEQSRLTVTTGNGSTTAEDIDLYLYKSDKAGDATTADGSSAGANANEMVAVNIDAAGYYLIRVAAATAAGGTYDGTAKLTASTQPPGTFPPSPVDEPTAATPPDTAPSGTTGSDGSGGSTTTTTVTTTTPADGSTTPPPDGGTASASTSTLTTTVPTPPPALPARANAAPKAYVAAPKTSRATAPRFAGTSSDDGRVKRVDVAIERLTGKRCRGLTSAGKLVSLKSCSKPTFLRAHGTTAWSLKLKHKLPAGSYVILARATDAAGKRQKGYTKTSRRRFSVR